jgi:predicted transcriptional regulator
VIAALDLLQTVRKRAIVQRCRKMRMVEPEPESILDIPLDEAAEAAADAAAEAEIDAGKGIPHALVRAWLESWGKPNELPCPLPPE